ncbi:MAG: helix-turn-helix transcriptional regulator [Rhodobiaceae bacterium]|nr:helix-turn-helix transcriptional regulator [Rhodobiaceae bacterium]MCC0051849.1 helix-turn-helix transcriptional regulator [Rhodobiaceae bacterium]
MTTSPRALLTSAICDDEPLTVGQRAYFRARLRSRVHEAILQIFLKEKENGLTKADLSRRLGKAPEQITRWLGGPGNLTLDTVSDILLAMKHELSFEITPIDQHVRHNEFHEMASWAQESASNQMTSTISIMNVKNASSGDLNVN